MSKTTNKIVVKIEMFNENGRESDIIEGRLLGMVTDEQYRAMMQDKSLVNRLSTVPTKSLSEIASLKDVANMRLALVIKSRNNKPISRRQMFFSAPFDMISTISSNTDISANGKDGSYMLINEYSKSAGE